MSDGNSRLCIAMVKFRWFIQFAYGNLDLTSLDLLSETERFFENQGALRIIYFGEISVFDFDFYFRISFVWL